MKQLPQITAVQSKVSFLDSELQREIYRQNEIRWFCKRRNKISSSLKVDGYETFTSCSVNIPLKGIVEICVINKEKGVTVFEIPTITQFLVTCISRHNGNYIPEIGVSLS